MSKKIIAKNKIMMMMIASLIHIIGHCEIRNRFGLSTITLLKNAQEVKKLLFPCAVLYYFNFGKFDP